MRRAGAAVVLGLIACSGSERRDVGEPTPVARSGFDAGTAKASQPADAGAGPSDAGLSMAAPPDAGRPAVSVGPPALPDAGTTKAVAAIRPTPDTRCSSDDDCHIFHAYCGGYCPPCPTTGEAVNRRGLRKRERSCKRARRRWERSKEGRRRHPGVHCSPCRRREGFPAAVCRQGGCVKVIRQLGDPDDPNSDPLKGL